MSATKAIRAQPGYAKTPPNLAMNDHIAKPVVPAVLYETLLGWLGKCSS
ncbi:MAG: hypothetical protein Q8M20_00985 [Rhodocyclaceae bacterium]|nr:hypothetical protein [Rhodocyclaceae bacterium]MDZ4214931.1 hypothetical protein [Rhodocyclaceae bacterium]